MLLQNNASREVYALYGLRNASTVWMYYAFDIELPDTAQAGEYTYYLTGVAVEPNIVTNSQPLLSVATLSADKTIVRLGQLSPEMGYVRIKGNNLTAPIYKGAGKAYIYYNGKK